MSEHSNGVAQGARPAIQFDVERYVADYEFRGDKGDYLPSDVERELLIDAIHGVVHEINQSFPTEATALTEGDRPYCDPMKQAEAFYLATYEAKGGIWSAVADEHKPIWVALARDYERRRRLALSSTDRGSAA